MIFWQREPWIMHVNLLLCQSQTPLGSLSLPPSLPISPPPFPFFYPHYSSSSELSLISLLHFSPFPRSLFFSLPPSHTSHQTGTSTGSGSYLLPLGIGVCYLAPVRRSLTHLHNHEGGSGTPGRDFSQRWAKTSTYIKLGRHEKPRFHSCGDGFSPSAASLPE